jgi:hydroxylamine reductase (hybrid-cluster protein)
MRKKIQLIIVALAVSLGISGMVLVPTATYAACTSAADCVQDGADKAGGKSSNTADPKEIIQTIVRILVLFQGQDFYRRRDHSQRTDG